MTRDHYLIGAGGTGSILFPLLVRALDTIFRSRDERWTLTVIDGKEVAASKLERQLFDGRFAGINKAVALAHQYATDPETVIAVPTYLDKRNIRSIRDGAMILIAADNFPVRARIEKHILSLPNGVVINGGNEMTDGSLQIFVRRNGVNITPPLSQGHAEILRKDGRDPAALSCEQIAELPSGEQTIIANSMSATLMLNAVRRYYEWESNADNAPFPPGEEAFFDMNTLALRATTRPSA
jgi:hypothetical protein